MNEEAFVEPSTTSQWRETKGSNNKLRLSLGYHIESKNKLHRETFSYFVCMKAFLYERVNNKRPKPYLCLFLFHFVSHTWDIILGSI